MNERMGTNLLIAALVLFLVSILLWLTGCTIYKAERIISPDGTVTFRASTYSTRNIDELKMEYSRIGADATFNLNAAGITQPGVGDYVDGVAAGLRMLITTLPEATVEETEDAE